MYIAPEAPIYLLLVAQKLCLLPQHFYYVLIDHRASRSNRFVSILRPEFLGQSNCEYQ